MRDFDDTAITEAVRTSFSGTQDPRLKAILDNLVGHLHDHVREVNLTGVEWRTAIDFLTRVGQTCDARRQEFILLSDVLGISTLVDAINHPQGDGETASTILGPFYVEDPPQVESGEDMAAGMPGDRLLVTGRVLGSGGAPIAGAVVDVWHADAEGFYDLQTVSRPIAGRGRLVTNREGGFQVWSVMPRYYPIPADGPVGDLLAATGRHPNRPAHVHFHISAPGYAPLTTQIYAADSAWLDSDAVFGVKETLVSDYAVVLAHPEASEPSLRQPHRRLDHDFILRRDASR